jgi:hypothetical protein
MKHMKNVHQTLVANNERKKPLKRFGHRIILKWIINKCEGVDWIRLGQDWNKWRGLVKNN